MQLETVLGTRHDETIRTQNELQKTSIADLARLQAQASTDSKLLKSLTVLATIYLPVNLTVVSLEVRTKVSLGNARKAFFSSNLVQVVEKGATRAEMRVWVLKDTWLLIAVSVPVVFLTILFIWYMVRKNIGALAKTEGDTSRSGSYVL